MRLGELGEDELLRRLLPYLATDGVEIGAGRDDTAVFATEPGYLVISCDASVEGVHFDLGWMSPEDAGWKALAMALGDLAAKGATPTHCLAMLALPASWDGDAVVALYRGMAELGRSTGIGIVGGDTTATAGPAILGLTVMGMARQRPLARAEVLPGWAVGVTGPLGSAAIALRDRRVQRLPPLLDEGRRLNDAGLCCGDISDGLLRELDKFAASSGAGCRLRLDQVPAFAGATVLEALASGEEVELVCTGPADLLKAVGIQPIGQLTEDPRVVVVDGAGNEVEVPLRGYRHFA